MKNEHGVSISTADLDAVVTFQAVIGPAPTAFEPHVQSIFYMLSKNQPKQGSHLC
jgi:hypothetical protein